MVRQGSAGPAQSCGPEPRRGEERRQCPGRRSMWAPGWGTELLYHCLSQPQTEDVPEATPQELEGAKAPDRRPFRQGALCIGNMGIPEAALGLPRRAVALK